MSKKLRKNTLLSLSTKSYQFSKLLIRSPRNVFMDTIYNIYFNKSKNIEKGC